FLNWLALRSTNVVVQGAVVLNTHSTNALSYSGITIFTNMFLGAANGTWTYSGPLTPVINNGFTTNVGTSALLLGGGNGTLDYAPVIGGTTGVVIGPVGSFGVVQLTNYNTHAGTTNMVIGGVLRAVDGIGLASTVNLYLNSGVFEVISSPTGATFSRSLGTGFGQVDIGGAPSGFSTTNGNLAINIGGAGATLQWGVGSFRPTRLILGTNTTDGVITLVNGIDLNGGTREIYVGKTAVLAGSLTNTTGTAELNVYGQSGTLIYSNASSTVPGIRLRFGTFEVATNSYLRLTNWITVGNSGNDVATLIFRAGSWTDIGLSFTNSVFGLIAGESGYGKVFIEPGATVGASVLFGGRLAGSMGAFYQSGGIVTNIGDNRTWTLGGAAGAFGYYNLSGGTLFVGGNNNRFALGAAAGSFGQMDMSGGSFSATGMHVSVGFGGVGVFNVSGGVFTQGVAGTGNRLIIADAAGLPNSLNVSGTGLLNLLGGLRVSWNNGATGVVNLLSGGTIITPNLDAKSPGTNANAVFNFNGGVLQASANNTNWFGGAGNQGGFNRVYVGPNGAFLDSSNFTINLRAGLVAPTGQGIASIPVVYSGQGYVTPPLVYIIGGGGSNATAYAVLDPVTGSVTNIVVTCAGEGYTSAPTVLLDGGTGSNGFAAAVGTPVLSSNTSGNLVKLGVGTATLVATNTYAGSTIVSNGLLVLSPTALYTGGGDLVVTTGGTFSAIASTGQFNDVFITGAGVITNGPGAVIALTGDFVNASTNIVRNDWAAGTFAFNGGGVTQLVEIASTYTDGMVTTNYFAGTFAVGDPYGGTAFVRLVDNYNHTVGAGKEILAASNIAVFAGSTLDMNSKTGFAFNMRNLGLIQQTNAGGIGRLDVFNTFTNQGTVRAGSGGMIQFSNSFVNAGLLEALGAGSSLQADKSLYNTSLGSLVASNSGSATVQGTLSNSGLV
ncbi:MAG: hypothetical protein N2439_17470, partial [Anaerolineae bacterium]|nr:hypothetical protein [Anaerolineae bacterium]